MKSDELYIIGYIVIGVILFLATMLSGKDSSDDGGWLPLLVGVFWLPMLTIAFTYFAVAGTVIGIGHGVEYLLTKKGKK